MPSCPNCKSGLIADELTCPDCGFKLTLDPELTGGYLQEPPLTNWAQNDDGQKPQYSKESMREIQREARERAQRAKKAANTNRSEFRLSNEDLKVNPSKRDTLRRVLIPFGVLALIVLAINVGRNLNSIETFVIEKFDWIKTETSQSVDSLTSSNIPELPEVDVPILETFSPTYGDSYGGGEGMWNFTRIYPANSYGLAVLSIPCSSQDQIDWVCTDNGDESSFGSELLPVLKESCSSDKGPWFKESIYDGSETLLAVGYPVSMKLMDLKTKNVYEDGLEETFVGCVAHFSLEIAREIDTPILMQRIGDDRFTEFPLGAVTQGRVTFQKAFPFGSGLGNDAPDYLVNEIQKNFEHPAMQ